MGHSRSLLCCLILHCINATGQTYIGISANLGNELKYTPESKGLKTPPAISGSLLIRKQQNLSNDWVLQYGGGLGILGYTLKVLAIDTILIQDPKSGKSVFWDYSTFYGNLSVLIGKQISIGQKKWMIGVGAGATYYLTPSGYYSYGVSVGDVDHPDQQLFYAEIESPINKWAAFAKIATRLTLTSSIAVGIEYSYHFKPLADGFYEFYHTKNLSSGKISLYQREFNFIFFVKLPKKRK